MFAQQLVNGLTVGAMYALIAIGYSMIYGILRIVNFAHGDIFMVGTFLGMTLIKVARLPFYIAFPLAAALTAGLGILIERFAYRPIRVADKLAVLISAIGVSIMLSNSAQLIFGTETHPFESGIQIRNFQVGSVTLTNIQVIMLALTALLLIILWILVQHTKIGVAMRAVSHNIDNAKLMGIDTNKVIMFTFGVGSVLATAAGILVGIYYDAVFPTMGYSYGLKAFASAVLGGIGSLPGAAFGGLIIGVIEALGAAYISSGLRNVFAFGIMIIVLIFKPTGLMGKNIRDKV